MMLGERKYLYLGKLVGGREQGAEFLTSLESHAEESGYVECQRWCYPIG